MSPVGDYLKRVREERSIDLYQVAAETKINLRYLQAIEENNLQALPGGLYTRAFLRAYAEYLGLDPNEILSLHNAAVPTEQPVEPSTGKVEKPLVTTTFTVLSALTIIFALIYIYHDHLTNLLRGLRASKLEPVARTEPAETMRLDVFATSRQQVRPAAEPANRVEDERLQLEIRALGECWLTLHADGVRVAYRMLASGSKFTYTAKERFDLRLGDAGAVELTLNGLPLKSLGKSGEVITVSLSRENYKSYVLEPKAQ